MWCFDKHHKMMGTAFYLPNGSLDSGEMIHISPTNRSLSSDIFAQALRSCELSHPKKDSQLDKFIQWKKKNYLCGFWAYFWNLLETWKKIKMWLSVIIFHSFFWSKMVSPGPPPWSESPPWSVAPSFAFFLGGEIWSLPCLNIPVTSISKQKVEE